MLSPGRLSRGPAGSAEVDALRRFPALVRELVAGGARGLLLREPDLEDGAFLRLAIELRGLLEREAPGSWLGLHDRAHLASAAGADGVHLAGHSLGAASVRLLVGEGTAIGVSTHAGDGPDRWEGADFVLHAPVFSPNSKPSAGPTLGPEGLRAFCASCPVPVWALGGVAPEVIPSLRATGAAGAAAIGAIWGSGDCGASGSLRARSESLVAAGRATFPPGAGAHP
ncbi:MAG: thiamine phosphate synthase [Planctomycetota bacterium]